MKRKAIKKVALFVALIMAATSFAGCGKKDEAAVSSGSPVTLNGDKIYPIQCDDTLTYWLSTNPNWTHRYENYADTPIGKKLAENTGVKVEYMHPAMGQGVEQFQILLASNELPDIVHYTWNVYPGGPDMAIKDEYILKLNDILPKYAPALWGYLQENEDWDKQSKSDKGSYYAFPQMSQDVKVAYGPVFRSDLLKKVNVELPRTIDEWEAVLTALKKNGVESPFIASAAGLIKAFSPAFGIYTGWYRNGDKVVYGQAQPQYKDLLIKLNDWYKKGLIDPDFASVDSKAIESKILNGQAGATLAWVGSGIGTWLNAMPDRNEFDIAGVQYPARKKGEPSEYADKGTSVSMASGVAISGNCVNVELAARFLDYGYTEEGHNLFNFGIEGESYNWVDRGGEKYPEFTDLILDNPEGLSVSQAMGMYLRASNATTMIMDKRYIEQYHTTTQQKEAQAEWGKTNMDEHILPELYIAEDSIDADADIMANVNTYIDEMTIKFITGNEPIENFDKYTEQIKKFGIEDATAFRQAAYEVYMNR